MALAMAGGMEEAGEEAEKEQAAAARSRQRSDGEYHQLSDKGMMRLDPAGLPFDPSICPCPTPL